MFSTRARARARTGQSANDFGYRRRHVLLRRQGFTVNLKRLFRLYREEHLMVRRRGGRRRALGAQAPMLVPQWPNDRWSLRRRSVHRRATSLAVTRETSRFPHAPARVADRAGLDPTARYRLRPCCLPRPIRRRYPGLKRLSRLNGWPMLSPVNASPDTSRCPRRMTKGQCGSLCLHCEGLSPSTPCRYSGAHWVRFATWSSAHRRMAFEVSSVALSLTIVTEASG